MVPQRRVDYGFNGYQMPKVPRASRSARGKGPIRKKLEGNQIHAFEILASVAGELLESENSLPSNASCGKDPHYAFDDTIRKQQNEGNSLKEEPCEWGSCDEEASLHACGVQVHQQTHTVNQVLQPQEHISFEMSATSKSNDQSEKVCFPKKLGTVDSSSSCGSYSNKVISDCPLSGDFIEEEEKAHAVRKRKLEDELSKDTSIKNGKVCSEDLIEMEGKAPELVSCKHDVKEPLLGDCKTHNSFLCHCVEVVGRDDGENFVGNVQPCTMVKEFEHKPDVGDRKIKKISASKHWQIAPDTKIGSYHRTDGKIKQVYHNGRPCYAHQRSQKIYPFKKRKFFYQKPFTTSDRGCNCENIYSSPDNREDGGNCNAEIGRSSSTIGREPLKSTDRNVRVSIKSFKVPELFFEIPATATVGSLKRTVMDAVTSILGDGLHVGILVQGKKVRDDNKTLLQTGISPDDKLDNLGFTLEPKHTKLMYSQCGNVPSSVSGRCQELTRHSASLVSRPATSNVSLNPTAINLGSSVDKDLKAVPSPASTSIVKTPPASQALVAVPPINAKPLAVVPFHRRSGHPVYVQRRMRRPFSVSEVEALVQAVEKLGTGRWRDVKMRAFDNAKHRTYVDLKDKWKTLVHTARISPQQRRGEPVPQELLDRVLAAHAYWSQRQAKQQLRLAAD
ncbi:telomere repeat-binding protein 5-like [Argentina anserina]|uniref:telomere repeat-binding protein 5-like n=1 Tax=Argentina anserina TaxID=57926 RepID=UPI00217654AC|nr:telomere repeat-binding protein 5-like [Potentilla anserina]XP_050379387.1 telomere repeat-binding protein 5-like [Potentilla anserina]XP_050379388.1 telomere repeat-binding protein 5-like [Potentilla anserina]XP_050379389.1 telomere repeat-binding protein 5-like [Potentilla anserina]XP_050379390.1 telomere repeat-binding protein 5-like [Potentilla anserina]XP_050379391.1 telomere repeat-binding protein 5-like [Potentilla anserina]